MIDTSREIDEVDTFVVDEGEANVRIDRILAERYRDVRSRSYFQYLIFNNYVLIDGQPVKKHYRPKAGSTVDVQFVLTRELNLNPENIPLDVIYEDEYLIAVNKPAGMVVHPAPGNWSGTFVNALLYHCSLSGDEFGRSSARPGIVHRLDKETSGVLVAAKDAVTQERLSQQFAERSISKEYIAICCGNPGEGEVNAPIGRHPIKRKQMTVREDGREAITRFETLASDGKVSVVKVNLITGRTHQIRVHMQHRGTPILGDGTYGSIDRNKKYRAERQLLHAWRLMLTHPRTGAALSLVATVPDDIKKYIKMFEIRLVEG